MAASPASDPATGQPDAGDTTVDELLGGAVRLMQPRHGYRVCMDTVMLAAAVPAGPRCAWPGGWAVRRWSGSRCSAPWSIWRGATWT